MPEWQEPRKSCANPSYGIQKTPDRRFQRSGLGVILLPLGNCRQSAEVADEIVLTGSAGRKLIQSLICSSGPENRVLSQINAELGAPASTVLRSAVFNCVQMFVHPLDQPLILSAVNLPGDFR